MKKILLTGLQETNQKAAEYISSLGLSSINFPLQKMVTTESTLLLPPECDWVFFTSATAVQFFFEKGFSTEGKKTAVVGPATRDTLSQYDVEADFMPKEDFSAEGLINDFCNPNTQIIFYPCSKIAKKTLQQGLEGKKHTVIRYDLYEPEEVIHKSLPDFTDIIFFSQSAVEIFQNSFGISSLENKKAAAIGKSTATAFKNVFNREIIQAPQSTVKATVDALL